MEKAADRTGRGFAASPNIVLNKHLSSLRDCFYIISVVCCGVHGSYSVTVCVLMHIYIYIHIYMCGLLAMVSHEDYHC